METGGGGEKEVDRRRQVRLVAIAVVVPDQSFTGTGAGEAGPIVKQVLQAYLTETGGQG